MPPTPPSTEPTELHIGASWEWDKHFSLAPPSAGWTLRYNLTGPSAVPEIVATPSAAGDYYEVRLASTATAGFTAGTYELQARVDDGAGSEHPVYRGTITLIADLGADTNAPSKDEAELAAVEAAVAQLAGGAPIAEVRINGRLTRYATSDVPSLYERQGILRTRILLARRGGRLLASRPAFRRA